jgi:hypothetical protein
VTRRFDGPPCPIDPTHGPLLEARVPAHHGYAVTGYFCPHIDHDGRPRAHPEGYSAPTKRRWTAQEVLP